MRGAEGRVLLHSPATPPCHSTLIFIYSHSHLQSFDQALTQQYLANAYSVLGTVGGEGNAPHQVPALNRSPPKSRTWVILIRI